MGKLFKTGCLKLSGIFYSRVRFKSDPDVAILTGTAVLLLVFTLNLGLASDRLTILDLRFLQGYFYLVSALKLADDNIDLLVAYRIQDLLACFGVS